MCKCKNYICKLYLCFFSKIPISNETIKTTFGTINIFSKMHISSLLDKYLPADLVRN